MIVHNNDVLMILVDDVKHLCMFYIHLPTAGYTHLAEWKFIPNRTSLLRL